MGAVEGCGAGEEEGLGEGPVAEVVGDGIVEFGHFLELLRFWFKQI